jgi:hypothetical protein
VEAGGLGPEGRGACLSRRGSVVHPRCAVRLQRTRFYRAILSAPALRNAPKGAIDPKQPPAEGYLERSAGNPRNQRRNPLGSASDYPPAYGSDSREHAGLSWAGVLFLFAYLKASALSRSEQKLELRCV